MTDSLNEDLDALTAWLAEWLAAGENDELVIGTDMVRFFWKTMHRARFRIAMLEADQRQVTAEHPRDGSNVIPWPVARRSGRPNHLGGVRDDDDA